MAGFTKAFEQMRRCGLIAEAECYCKDCASQVLLRDAQHGDEEPGDFAGFVHVSEREPVVSPHDLRIPLVFGAITDGQLVYRGRGCLAVGDIVAKCLKDQGIGYEWDRVPGHPILVKPDHSLPGLSGQGDHRMITSRSDIQTVAAPVIPATAFDQLEGNPVRLVNVAKVRRLKLAAALTPGRVKRPRVGGTVRLGFVVRDAIAPEALQVLGDLVHRLQVESMSVEVTGVLGQYPECVYRGELLDEPEFIDPDELGEGSPVTFTPDHVYPAQTSSRCQE
jgi:hypothetical protein